MISRLVSAFVVILAAVFAMPGAMAASVPSGVEHLHVFTYDGDQHTVAVTYTASERGPPAQPRLDTTYDPDGLRPVGLLVRSDGFAPPSIYGYDGTTGVVQTARGSQEGDERSGASTEAPVVLERSESAAKAGDEAFHYTSSKWLDGIMSGGLRKGTYATPDGSLSPLQATLDLALPPNRALPNATLRIDLAGLRKAGYEIPTPSRVSSTVTGSGGRVYNMPGGGYEMQFPYEIPPQFLSVVPR